MAKRRQAYILPWRRNAPPPSALLDIHVEVELLPLAQLGNTAPSLGVQLRHVAIVQLANGVWPDQRCAQHVLLDIAALEEQKLDALLELSLLKDRLRALTALLEPIVLELATDSVVDVKMAP